jgi:cytochrome o ubiquinol oxidase subunit I
VVDYWIWAFQIAGVGSLITSINLLVTILKMHAAGISFMRMSIFVGGSIWIMYSLYYRMM